MCHRSRCTLNSYWDRLLIPARDVLSPNLFGAITKEQTWYRATPKGGQTAATPQDLQGMLSPLSDQQLLVSRPSRQQAAIAIIPKRSNFQKPKSTTVSCLLAGSKEIGSYPKFQTSPDQENLGIVLEHRDSYFMRKSPDHRNSSIALGLVQKPSTVSAATVSLPELQFQKSNLAGSIFISSSWHQCQLLKDSILTPSLSSIISAKRIFIY